MENIQVAARIRPINTTERNNLEVDLWKNDSQTNTIMASADSYQELIKQRKIIPGQKTAYTLDKTFDKVSTNENIYQDVVQRIGQSSLQGINGTIFMYGQTGSGKTYTMLGTQYQEMIQNNIKNASPSRKRQRNKSQETKKVNNQMVHRKNFSSKSPQKLQFIDNNYIKKPIIGSNLENQDKDSSLQSHQEDGILVKALKDIFQKVETSDKQYFFKVSYIEIYTDFVYDLLKERDELQETCTINEDQNKEFYIKGANEEMVYNIEQVLELLQKGEQNRHYASTTMNHVSSRSHTIFRLYVKAIPKQYEQQRGESITESVLNFVDLAGSEKIGNHITNKQRNNSMGQQFMQNQIKDRQNESKNINKSLFFLTQVISLKSQNKPDIMIPYRNSPLTKILRSSLGGNSRTAVILCINPCSSQLEQSFSTLKFGLNAKKIQNQVQRNIVLDTNDEVMKGLINEYEKRINDIESEKQNSKKLMNMIENLTEQKNSLQERLNNAKEQGFIGNGGNQLLNGIGNNIKDQKCVQEYQNTQYSYNHLHYNGIGIITVLQQNLEKKGIQHQYENSYIMKEALKNVNAQKQILIEKSNVMQQKLEEYYLRLEQEKCKYEDKLLKKKSKIKTIKQQKIALEEENSKLRQQVQFFQNRNMTGLKQTSLQFIEQQLKSAQILQENLQTQKSYLQLKQLCENNPSTKSLYSNLEKLQDSLKFQFQEQQIIFPENFYEAILDQQQSLTDTQKLKQIESQLTSITKQASQNCKQDDSENFLSFQNYFNTKKEEHQQLIESYDDKISQMNSQYENFIQKLRQTPNNPGTVDILNTETSVSTQVFKEPLKHFDIGDGEFLQNMNQGYGTNFNRQSTTSCYSVQSSMSFSSTSNPMQTPIQSQRPMPQFMPEQMTQERKQMISQQQQAYKMTSNQFNKNPIQDQENMYTQQNSNGNNVVKVTIKPISEQSYNQYMGQKINSNGQQLNFAKKQSSNDEIQPQKQYQSPTSKINNIYTNNNNNNSNNNSNSSHNSNNPKPVQSMTSYVPMGSNNLNEGVLKQQSSNIIQQTNNNGINTQKNQNTNNYNKQQISSYIPSYGQENKYQNGVNNYRGNHHY